MVNKRKSHRESVPNGSGPFVVIGRSSLLKYELLNLSEGGMKVRIPKKQRVGSQHLAFLEFPWLDDSIEVNFTVMNVLEKMVPRPKSDKDDDKNDEPEEQLFFDTSCRFDSLTFGKQELIFRQVAHIGRLSISANQESA